MGSYINVLIALIQQSLGDVFTKEIKDGFVTVERAEIALQNNGSSPSFVLGGKKGILDTNDVYVLLGYALNYKKDSDGPTVLFKDVALSGIDANQQKALRRLYESGIHSMTIINGAAIPESSNGIFQFPPRLIQGFPENFVPATKLIAFSGNSASFFSLKAVGDTSAIGTGIACLELLMFRIPNVGSATFTNSYEVVEIV